MTTMVIQWLGLERDVHGLLFDRDDPRGTEQLQAAEQEVRAKRDQRVRGQVRPVGVPLLAGQADLVHQPVDDDAGRRKGRERHRPARRCPP